MGTDGDPDIEQLAEDILNYVSGYREMRDEVGRSCLVCWRSAVIKDQDELWWCLKHYTG